MFNLGLLFCVYACVPMLSHSPLLPVLGKALTDNLPNSPSCMGKGRERGLVWRAQIMMFSLIGY